MRVPVEWIRDYVKIEDIALHDLIEGLVLSGSNNEGYAHICEGISGVVVGHIDSILPHPGADRLRMCMVDVGEEVVQIITGATNVQPGDYVPVALHGAVLANGIKIKRGKLRGEVSNGMLCSLEELGFEAALIPKAFDDGILILDDISDMHTGDDILDVLRLKDAVIDFEITPNRPDCLSMVGMARELSATFEQPLMLPQGRGASGTEGVIPFSVDIEAPELCPRYVARYVEQVEVKPSPLWMQLRLMQAGMRPINNIVDISNYVMLEYGQPIHAFDADTLKGGRIVVRRAGEGEGLKTLDGVERNLTSDMLVIADAERAVALAGIMGGAETEICPETDRVLIEVAGFERSVIRQTSKAIGLRSEASSRFEKGIGVALLDEVANRMCALIEDLGAGKPVSGVVDSYAVREEAVCIPYSVAHINAIIGTACDAAEIQAYLKRLDIETEETAEGNLVAHIPPFRMDLTEEIDLVEEVARLYGYDRIETTLPKAETWSVKRREEGIKERVQLELAAAGVDEMLSYSFGSRKVMDALRRPEADVLRRQVALLNPIGEDFSVMRTTLMPAVLEALALNLNRKNEALRLYELGTVFFPKDMPVSELPEEPLRLTVGISGIHEDFFTLKGIVASVMDGMRIPPHDWHVIRETQDPTFHPGKCGRIFVGELSVGIMGEVHPLVAEAFGLTQHVYMAELDYTQLTALATETPKYAAIPKYPAVERDMAILVKDETTSKDIEDIVKREGDALLESVKMFDMYKGKQIEQGYKSVAYALTFRSSERTLVDEEVNAVFDAIVEALTDALGAQLR